MNRSIKPSLKYRMPNYISSGLPYHIVTGCKSFVIHDEHDLRIVIILISLRTLRSTLLSEFEPVSSKSAD